MQQTTEERFQAAPSRQMKTLRRLLPRLDQHFRPLTEPAEWESFVQRLQTHFPVLFQRLYALYGAEYDFFYHLESIFVSAAESWLARSGELKALDAMREADPHWFLSHRMVGAMCYVDLFAGTLTGLQQKVSYLTELGSHLPSPDAPLSGARR